MQSITVADDRDLADALELVRAYELERRLRLDGLRLRPVGVKPNLGVAVADVVLRHVARRRVTVVDDRRLELEIVGPCDLLVGSGGSVELVDRALGVLEVDLSARRARVLNGRGEAFPLHLPSVVPRREQRALGVHRVSPIGELVLLQDLGAHLRVGRRDANEFVRGAATPEQRAVAVGVRRLIGVARDGLRVVATLDIDDLAVLRDHGAAEALEAVVLGPLHEVRVGEDAPHACPKTFLARLHREVIRLPRIVEKALVLGVAGAEVFEALAQLLRRAAEAVAQDFLCGGRGALRPLDLALRDAGHR